MDGEKKNVRSRLFSFLADAFHWPWFRSYILRLVKRRPFGHPSPSHRNSFFFSYSLFFAVLPFCCLFICRLFLLTLCVSVEFSAANSQIIRYARCQFQLLWANWYTQTKRTPSAYYLFFICSIQQRKKNDMYWEKKKKKSVSRWGTDLECRSWQKYLMLFSMWLTDGVVAARRWWRLTALANSSSLLSLETSQVFNWKSIRFRCRNDSHRSLALNSEFLVFLFIRWLV